MKRVAFVGAGAAWAAVQCSDEVLPGLLDAASEFGWTRINANDLPKAFGLIESAKAADLNSQLTQAQSLIKSAVVREIGALRSTETIYTGSPAAVSMVAHKAAQWQSYGDGWNGMILSTARLKAAQLGVEEPKK
jgi:hypothetical protein